MSDVRAWFERAAAWIDEYYREPLRFPVLSRAEPGALRDALPSRAPEHGESFETIFSDFERLIVPGITHWNHPRFFAYFAISAAPIAVVAEALAAALDVNAMLWRTSPAATELEDVVTEWLRDLLGLDTGLSGIVYDTASTGGFTALASAREALDLEIRERGAFGRELPRLRVYITDHTHSHIEKGAIALGIGRDNVVRVPVDSAYRMDPAALEAALRTDYARGMQPMAIVATAGTTSTTSSDPIEAIGAIAARYGVWFHVDAAYAGPAAMLPEFRSLLAGTERADSLVVNPHKWMFVPVDLSVLYLRRPEITRRAFSLVADYLQTPETGVRNYMDYGLQLGRRFRALKLWFALRHYGAEGMRDLIRGHVALAQTFAQTVEATPPWRVVAPHPLSVVCFRYEPPGVEGEASDALNATGEAYLSTTRLDGRLVVRLAIGNERTTAADVEAAWSLLCAAAERETAVAP
jgi:aromatic-L-amino-acid decarboxylase